MIKYYGKVNRNTKEELKQFCSFLEKYFNKKIKLIKVNVYEKRWEFDKKLNKVTPDWMVGSTFNNEIE